MAYNKHDDQYVMPRPAGRNTAQEGFWKARDAVSQHILSPVNEDAGFQLLAVIIAECKNLPEVTEFLALGTTPMLESLYKHWINDAISSALKTYINQKP